MKRTALNNSGFTAIEIICVLLIIGILSAVAVSRFGSTDEYGLVAETDTLKTHLRYAQFRAMSDDTTWKAELTSTSYTLYHRDTDGNWAPSSLPDTPDSATHTFNDQVTKAGGNLEVIFDQWGSPDVPSGTPLITDITITLNKGNTTRTITITKDTGFIP